jgi:hypothetical protein
MKDRIATSGVMPRDEGEGRSRAATTGRPRGGTRLHRVSARARPGVAAEREAAGHRRHPERAPVGSAAADARGIVRVVRCC